MPSNSDKVSNILHNFPEVTSGLGKLINTQVKLNIDTTVKPVSHYLRRVPFHIRRKIESKIDVLLKLDITEPVSEATPWVSPLLGIPKVPKNPKNDDVRIAVDIQKPNTAIKRTHHPIPTIDETFEKFINAQCLI